MDTPDEAARDVEEAALVKTIARRVARLRQQHDLSLDEVAARAGLSKSRVWEVEQGRQRRPTVQTVKALARAFGVSMAAILGENTSAAQLSPEALKVAAMFDAQVRAILAAQQGGGERG